MKANLTFDGQTRSDLPRQILTIQTSARPDHIFENGEMGYQLPYPFHADEWGVLHGWAEDSGPTFPKRIIGFQRDLAKDHIDIWWRDAWKDPRSLIGTYVVTADGEGNWSTHTTSVESVDEVY